MKCLNLIVVFLFSLLVSKCCRGKEIFVSVGGPISSIAMAAAQAIPGDAIVIQNGIYNQTQVVGNLKGNSTHWITVRSLPGHMPIFDTKTPTASCFWLYRWEFVVIEGPFEIKNCPALGIGLTTANHVIIKNLHIHHAQNHGIAVTGTNIVVKDCEIHDCVMRNVNGSSSGWDACLSTWRIDSETFTSNVLFENNYVHSCWGEGIDFWGCDTCVSKGNTIRNAWSVLHYMDNAKNILLDGNVLMVDNENFNRSHNRATGILLGTENNTSIRTADINITIRNNLIISPQSGISFYPMKSNESFYSDVRIVHNTFVCTFGFGMSFPTGFTNASKNNELSNNVFIISFVRDWNNGGYIHPNERNTWKVFSNLWVGKPGIAIQDSQGFNGTSSVIPVIDLPSLFTLAGKKCGGSKLTLGRDPECYNPNCNGPLLNTGLPSSFASKTDKFGYLWSANHPSIGFSSVCSHAESQSQQQHEASQSSSFSSTSSLFLIFVLSLLWSTQEIN